MKNLTLHLTPANTVKDVTVHLNVDEKTTNTLTQKGELLGLKVASLGGFNLITSRNGWLLARWFTQISSKNIASVLLNNNKNDSSRIRNLFSK